MIAGQGPVQMQAQAGQAEVSAKGLVNVQSANAHISAEGITTQCPGKITIKAAAPPQRAKRHRCASIRSTCTSTASSPR